MTQTRTAEVGETSAGRVSLTQCDVTDDAAVTAFIEQTSGLLGDHGLDLLISNAGILTPGPLELLPPDAIRHEFEVNVFASLRIINGFLPALRKAQGRIVQISSMTARVPLPFNGPSSASKAALEAFADVYRAELRTSGVDFVTVLPGSMRTGGPAKTAAALQQISDSMSPEQRELYGDPFDAFTKILNEAQSAGTAAPVAAQRIIQLAEQVPAPIREPVGPDAEQTLQMARELSDAGIDQIRLSMIGLLPADRIPPGADPDRVPSESKDIPGA